MIVLIFATLVVATLLFLVFLLNQQVKFALFVLKFVIKIVDLITLPIYLLIDQPWKVELPSKIKKAERHYEPNGDYYYWQAIEVTDSKKLSPKNQELKCSLEKLTHLSQLLDIVGRAHKGKRCLGTRKILGKKLVDGEVKFVLSDEYEWKSYEEVLETISEFAKVLHHKFQLKRGDRVAVFAEVSPEFFIMFFALQSLGCEVVLLRSTPNETSIPFVLNQNEVELVFTQTNFIGLLNKLKSNIQTVRRLICFRHPFAGEVDEEEVRNVKYEFFEYEQLLKDARGLPSIEKNSSFSPTDISTIINTSGSSGLPKGVLSTHANWTAFINKLNLGLNHGNTFLAYLEGSHIMELLREFAHFTLGSKIAFGTYQTYLTGSPLLAAGCIGDLKASEATQFMGHPQTLEHVRRLIETWISESAYLAPIYRFAYEYKRRWTERGFRCRLMDTLVFSRLKNRLSPRLVNIFTGGAPLQPETGIFLKLHLNVNLVIGYGATETLGVGLAEYNQFDHADTHIIARGVKLRLENWEEGGYRVDDKPNARGEIIVGSDTVCAGYYKNEEETDEAFFEENGTRWWRSGDIGEINQYGQLSIIDRKSNFVKLQSGNYYIAMSKVDSVLKGCPLVENIAIHVNPYRDYVTAIVSPNEANIRKLAEELGIPTDDLSRLYRDEQLEKAVVDELTKFGTTNGLIPMEVPSYVKLVPEKWTPENGLVTETLKTRRNQIYAFYKNALDEMYNKSV